MVTSEQAKETWKKYKSLGIPIGSQGKKQPEKAKKINKEKHLGNKNPNWKGGKYKGKDGYIYEFYPNHPYANIKGYIFEHRLVMEKYIKRLLLPTEIVHHINENRSDNRIENLQLLKNLGEHNIIHKTKMSL